MILIHAHKSLSPNSSRLEQPGEEDIEVARQEIKTSNALSDNSGLPRKRKHDEVAADVDSSVPKRNDHRVDHQEARRKRGAAVDSARSDNQQMLRELILQ
jgi:hypothetical protein